MTTEIAVADACRAVLDALTCNVIKAITNNNSALSSMDVAVDRLRPRLSDLPARVHAACGSDGDAWIAARLDPGTVLAPHAVLVVQQVTQNPAATATLVGHEHVRLCWTKPATVADVRIPDPVVMARELAAAAATAATVDMTAVRVAVLDLALREICRGIAAAHQRGQTAMLYNPSMLRYQYGLLEAAHQRALLATPSADDADDDDDRVRLQRRVDALIAVETPATHLVPYVQKHLAARSPYYTVSVLAHRHEHVSIAWAIPHA
jgi:hypothetical protein